MSTILKLAVVPQISDYHCFPACLESYFKDIGIAVSQKDIVNRCPLAHNKGQKIEGGLNLQLLHDVEKEFSLSITPILSPNFSFNFPKQSIFIFTFWNDDSGQFHCVRYAGEDNGLIYLMNPKVTNDLEKLDLGTFSKWGKMLLLVEK